MWGPKNGKFLTPKVLAARPNLWEWWVGEKNCRNDNVVNDGIVHGLLAITKTMRIQFFLIRRQVRTLFLVMVFPPCKRILWIQKILRLW
jgi:hypothetical protein